MAISVVNTAQTGSATVTLPTGIKVGDLIVLIGYRNTTTAPSLATGYTAPTGSTVSANSNSGRMCWKRATGSESGTTVTMTNANVIKCVVYRGAWNVGTVAWTTNAASLTTNIPTITLQVTDGTSWVLCAAGSRQTTSQSTPAGLTIRGTAQTGTTAILTTADTNAGVASSAARTSTAGSSATGAGVAIELLASKAASTLSDNFDDNSLDGTKWSSGTIGAGSTVTESSQQINEAPASAVADAEGYLVGVNFDPKYTLVGDAFFVKLPTILVANAATFNYFWVLADDSNSVRIQISGSPRTIKVFQIVAGVETEKSSISYDAVNHIWLKISESGGTLNFGVSPDHNSGYTSLASFANPISVDSVYPKMNAYAGIVTTPGTAVWDYFNVAPGTAWSQSNSDTATSSEALVKTVTKRPTDTATPSEAIVKATTANKADTATATEAISKSITKNLTDSVTSSEAATPLLTHRLALADSVTPSETATKAVTARKADTATSSEAATKSVSKPLADTVTTSDVITKTPRLNKSDSVTSSEASTKTPTLNKSDSVTSSEASTRTPTLNKSDSVTSSESSIKTTTKRPSDTVTPTDAATKTLSKTIADSVTSSEAVAKQLGKALFDDVTPTDAVTKAVALVRGDSVTIADAVSKLSGISKADSTSVAEAMVKAVTKYLGDSVTTSDAATPTHTTGGSNHTLNLTDSVATTDASQRVVSKALVDSVSASDLVAKTFAHFIADQLNATDAETKHLIKLLADDVAVDDAVSRAMGKHIDDSVTTSDLTAMAFPIVYALADVVVVSDEIRLYINGERVKWYRRDPDTYEIDQAGPWFDRVPQEPVQSANADWYTKNQGSL